MKPTVAQRSPYAVEGIAGKTYFGHLFSYRINPQRKSR